MSSFVDNCKTLMQDSLPSNWEINMHEGAEASCILGLAHKNPVLHANPILLKCGIISSKGNTTTSTQGSEIKSPQYKEFIDTMVQHPFPKVRKAFTKVQKSIKEASKAFPATMHTTGITKEYDYVFNLVIASYSNDNTAKTILENYRDSPMQGVDFKVPGVKIPGISGTPSIIQTLSNPLVQEQMKEYMKPSEIQEVLGQIRDVSAEMKQQMKKDDVKFSIQKCSGGDALRRSQKPVVYMMIRYGKYILSGDFIQSITSQKPGSTPCDSLTKYRIKVTKEKIGDESFIDREIIPLKSNYKTEGYLYREEMKNILVKIKLKDRKM
ncbi:MAG: hypothetical protein U9Q67_02940 [Patescibacteria group bacterium]|nr:hypothetical protein [Patescibacteria group bacterium]